MGGVGEKVASKLGSEGITYPGIRAYPWEELPHTATYQKIGCGGGGVGDGGDGGGV